ncbi:hypothetical protein [Nocardia nova]|uniref:hypothetical protein n=1 Tax=Nocardia nova TaxID=37330 RepID=UPI0033FA0F1A
MVIKRESLPSLSRLQEVWMDPGEASTPLEYATQISVTAWAQQFQDLDPERLRSPSGVGEKWQREILGAVAVDAHAVIARVIDDEFTWHLGNRPQCAVLIPDDDTETLTAGELIGKIAMATVLMEMVPLDLGENLFVRFLLDVGIRYDQMVIALDSGARRQLRRRSHGAPPIPKPRRMQVVDTCAMREIFEDAAEEKVRKFERGAVHGD